MPPTGLNVVRETATVLALLAANQGAQEQNIHTHQHIPLQLEERPPLTRGPPVHDLRQNIQPVYQPLMSPTPIIMSTQT